MEEAFLHYLWKFKKFDFINARTTEGEETTIIQSGTLNDNSGPDFLNSKISIGGQVWAGNVEIHLKSSFWFAHGHQSDKAYDNVILHVVWEHDREVYRKDRSKIPVLELKQLVPKNSLQVYNNLFSKNNSNWINCESNFMHFETFLIDNWLERLFIERLEQKAEFAFSELKKSGQDWEEVTFRLLAKNFGLNINGDAFLSMATATPIQVLRKVASDSLKMEALLFGQAKLLEKEEGDPYFFKLKNEYYFLKRKFNLSNIGVVDPKFFRLRPDNFPTIRLAQLAAVYASEQNMFSKIIAVKTIEEIKSVFDVVPSDYWGSHYKFNKESKRINKGTSNSFLALIVVNTIIPIKFCFAKQQGRNVEDEIFELASSLKLENNKIIKGFNDLRKGTAKNSLHSQGLLQLKKEYCDKNRCLSCSLGNKLLS